MKPQILLLYIWTVSSTRTSPNTTSDICSDFQNKPIIEALPSKIPTIPISSSDVIRVLNKMISGFFDLVGKISTPQPQTSVPGGSNTLAQSTQVSWPKLTVDLTFGVNMRYRPAPESLLIPPEQRRSYSHENIGEEERLSLINPYRFTYAPHNISYIPRYRQSLDAQNTILYGYHQLENFIKEISEGTHLNCSYEIGEPSSPRPLEDYPFPLFFGSLPTTTHRVFAFKVLGWIVSRAVLKSRPLTLGFTHWDSPSHILPFDLTLSIHAGILMITEPYDGMACGWNETVHGSLVGRVFTFKPDEPSSIIYEITHDDPNQTEPSFVAITPDNEPGYKHLSTWMLWKDMILQAFFRYTPADKVRIFRSRSLYEARLLLEGPSHAAWANWTGRNVVEKKLRDRADDRCPKCFEAESTSIFDAITDRNPTIATPLTSSFRNPVHMSHPFSFMMRSRGLSTAFTMKRKLKLLKILYGTRRSMEILFRIQRQYSGQEERSHDPVFIHLHREITNSETAGSVSISRQGLTVSKTEANPDDFIGQVITALGSHS